jgi:succinoglycan biosynthesis protein ExoA
LRRNLSSLELEIGEGTVREYPLVSVVVPCRNEALAIKRTLTSLVNSDYPKDRLEILVVDGQSDDGSTEILEEFAEQYDFIRVVENAKRITPAAMNLGIAQSMGSVVCFFGAHAQYPRNYLSECVRAMREHGADCVGGRIAPTPRTRRLFDEVIASALAHPFCTGPAYYKIGAREARWVDTVFGACYLRKALEETGEFNEKLIRSQDIEYNLRFRRTGKRILMLPRLEIRYYPYSGVYRYVKHTFRNGVWSILPLKYSVKLPVSLRHFVPLAFVSSLAVLGGLAFWQPVFSWLLLAELGVYTSLAVLSSVHASLRRRRPSFLVAMPIVLLGFHVIYGLGSCWGVLRLMCPRRIQ